MESAPGLTESRRAGVMFLALCILTLLLACGDGAQPTTPALDQSTQVSVHIGDDWEEASLADVGMEAKPIDRLIRLLGTHEHEYHSLLVVKDGKLVVEEYFGGQDAELRDYEFPAQLPVIPDGIAWR